MRRMLLAFGLLLALVSPAFAQTHPCDTVPPPNPTVTQNTVIVGFCHDLKDAKGNVEPLSAYTFQPALDGQRQGLYVALTPQGTPNTAGKYYFEFPTPVVVSRGSHNVSVWSKDLDGEVASAPYPFVVSGPGPTAATGARVR